MLGAHPFFLIVPEPIRTMWPAIDRARRLLLRSPEPTAPDDLEQVLDDAAMSPATPARPVEDVVIILGSQGVGHLRAALEDVLGETVERADTPARIERALAMLLVLRGATGKPSVLRRPAGVSTPESWEIHLDGVDRATSRAVRAAGRNGFFAS
ncbi:MAG TPA: hypothetical protein VGO15_10880 [Candidatus Limnocylindrales bacterium]|nr:hypothetical protein [Candidatus Limnocylindrales bacterium]